MTLAADTTLGPYQIESLIGRGGMGEVYRARDTRLNRDVAIKVLPGSVANDEERIARFEREAKLLATLSHHHIAGIYGMEQIDGVRFLVLELVEGETLAERLTNGALPVEETLRLCRQLADGVAAAHERGVLHRDLKPANIKITTDDEVKVLDFGIAKALGSSAAGSDPANAETITGSHHTAAGAVVGTPSYMSPEQARGKALDKRTDVWSFGCVMYECLVGRLAFGGETATDSIARILEREPDYSALPALTPPTVRLLLHRCLQKDRQKRLHDLRDARLAIEEAIADPTGTTLGLGTAAQMPSASRRRAWLPWLLALACAALAVVALWTSRAATGSTEPAPPTYLSLLSTQAKLYWESPGFDISPDGRTLVYVARRNAADTAATPPYELVVRRLESAEATPIAGTERAFNPVFSPSGRWIAFLANDQSSPPNLTLKRVRFDGTPPVTIANIADQNYWMALWLSNETLLLSGWDGKPIFATVSVESGNLQSVQLDTSSLGDYVTLVINSVLPDGSTALGTVFRQFGVVNRVDTLLISLDTWACRTLLENADEPRYATSGHLIFARDRSLAAVPFDPATGTTLGGVTPLLSGVGTYRLSRSNSLVYHPVAESLASRRLFTVDALGKVEALSPVKKPFLDNLVGSVDGSWLAVEVFDDALANSRIWAYEVQTDSIRPVTDANELCVAPCISPDGRLLAYTRWSKGEISLVIRALDGSVNPGTLLSLATGKGWAMATCWSPDSRHVLVHRWEKMNSDILRVPIDGGDPVPLLASSASETSARLSPDGTLLAYSSDESGESNPYVRTYDPQSAALGPKRRLTWKVGSDTLFWSQDGKTLYFVDENKQLMAANVTAEPALTISDPRSVFDFDTLRAADDSFAPLSDGRIAFIRKGDQETLAEHLNVVLNWDSELNAKAPVAMTASR